MKSEVIKRFRDKETDTIYNVGSSFESTDNDRVNYLEQKGFLKSSKKTAAVKKEPVTETVKKPTERKATVNKKSGE